MRLAYSGSLFRLRFRFLASHSGSGRAVEEPEIVYTGTAEWFDNFIFAVRSRQVLCGQFQVLGITKVHQAESSYFIGLDFFLIALIDRYSKQG